jgi:hypothetical protein
MATLSTKNTYVAVKKETTADTIITPTASDFVLVDEDLSFEHGYEEIARAIMNGNLDDLTPLQGMQNGSVTLTCEMKGSGTAKTAGELDALLRACFDTPTNPLSGGDKQVDGNAALLVISGTPSTTTMDVDHSHGAAWFEVGDVILVDISGDGSGNYEQTTVSAVTFDTDHDELTVSELSSAPTAGNAVQLISRIEVDDTPGLVVGDIIKVDIDQTGSSPSYEYVLITAASGAATQSLTLSPYLSAEPLDDNDVIGGITYKQKESGHDTLSVHIFLDCDGQDGVWLKFGGCRPNMTLQNVSTGQIPKLQFTLQATSWTVVHSGSNLSTLGVTPTLDTDTEPPLCLGADITLDTGEDEETIHTQRLELDLGLEVVQRNSMIPSSGIRSSRYRRRNVTGVFDLDLEDVSEYTAWDARSTAIFRAQFGDTAGNIPVLIMPEIKRTNVMPVDSDGLWTQDISFKAERSSTLVPVYLAFF